MWRVRFQLAGEMNVQTDWMRLYGKRRVCVCVCVCEPKYLIGLKFYNFFPTFIQVCVCACGWCMNVTQLHLLNDFYFMRFINWSFFETLTQEHSYFQLILPCTLTPSHSHIACPQRPPACWMCLPFKWVNIKKKINSNGNGENEVEMIGFCIFFWRIR